MRVQAKSKFESKPELKVGRKATIQVNQLNYSIANNDLLKQVSCRFETGKIHAILGQNGAGKSTLLGCLSHEVFPSQGHILWNDEDLSLLSYTDLARQRAVLSQSQELAFSFTVQELIELGEEVQQRSQKEARSVVETVLKVCDMTQLRHRDYLTLSGGEQKRAQLARVLAQIWPENYGLNEIECHAAPLEKNDAFAGLWLFLDEWTAGLDIKHQQRLGRYFKQWAKQGLGIIMVLHDISFAAQLANRCLILKGGRVFANGSPNETLTQVSLQTSMEMSVRVETDFESGHPLIYPLLESF